MTALPYWCAALTLLLWVFLMLTKHRLLELLLWNALKLHQEKNILTLDAATPFLWGSWLWIWNSVTYLIFSIILFSNHLAIGIRISAHLDSVSHFVHNRYNDILLENDCWHTFIHSPSTQLHSKHMYWLIVTIIILVGDNVKAWFVLEYDTGDKILSFKSCKQ